MKDDECISFLQWLLPQMHMRWAGFRKIRTRVCKRIQRHIATLQLTSVAEYRAYLEVHSEEWHKLDELCQVTISRFYRDKMVFAYLAETVLPTLCQQVVQQGRRDFRVWSVGCASGEEAYSLELLWSYFIKQNYPQLSLQILATDTKHELLDRAQQACYSFSSVRNLPDQWREQAFLRSNDDYCLQAMYKQGITFQYHDIRQAVPATGFDLILCRNLAFTYYDQELQKIVAKQLITTLNPGGGLVLGVHEVLPTECAGIEMWSKRFSIYRKHH
jgi:chemotaxis protein methyltransferase CheR